MSMFSGYLLEGGAICDDASLPSSCNETFVFGYVMYPAFCLLLMLVPFTAVSRHLKF